MLCQVVFEGKSVTRGTFDSWRLFKFTLLGGALVGPVLHNWYLTLANIVKVPGTAGVVARLVLDQGVFAPFFISTFIACLMAMDGDLANVPAKLRQDLGETVVTNWKIWLPFQFLNFRFVPQQFQVLAANVVALVWNVCLSFISNRAVEDPAAAGAKKA
ncbi:unnamed protein product [Pedinophyceae sp. YPF-701]|nr:unnamed protein product [Pedinophyceae sp. YPF-701]